MTDEAISNGMAAEERSWLKMSLVASVMLSCLLVSMSCGMHSLLALVGQFARVLQKTLTKLKEQEGKLKENEGRMREQTEARLSAEERAKSQPDMDSLAEDLHSLRCMIIEASGRDLPPRRDDAVKALARPVAVARARRREADSNDTGRANAGEAESREGGRN